MTSEQAMNDALADAIDAVEGNGDVSPLEAAMESDALFDIFAEQGCTMTSIDLLGSIDASLDFDAE